MASKIVWSDESLTDLEALAEFIGKDSPYYAAAFAQEILDAARLLQPFPARGRIVPEIGSKDIREVLVKSYRLIYKIEETSIVVLALIHGARDLDALWEREDRG